MSASSIAGNDFNLNISRYVDTTEPIEVPSVEEALAQLREANDTAAKEPPEPIATTIVPTKHPQERCS